MLKSIIDEEKPIYPPLPVYPSPKVYGERKLICFLRGTNREGATFLFLDSTKY